MAQLLQIFFQLLYRQFAFLYDLVAAVVSVGQWQEWVFSALPYLGDTPCLEIGFGPGHLLKKLQTEGVPILGLDLSPQMVHRARKSLPGHQKVSVIQGDSGFLPLSAASIGTILSTFPAPAIYAPNSLREIWRVLRPGGRFVTIPSARLHPNSLWLRLAHWAFIITGQASSPDTADISSALSSWAEYGFSITVLEHRLENSTVLVVIAEKILVAMVESKYAN